MLSRLPDPKPRITFLTVSLDVGGTEQHLATVTPELVRRGWPVTIFCLNRLGAFVDPLRQAGVEVIGPPVEAQGRATPSRQRVLLSSLASLRFLAHLMWRRPGIAHFFLPEAYLLGAPLAMLAGVPVRVMSRRDVNVHFERWPLARTLEEKLHTRMSAVLGNSMRVIEDLVSEKCPHDRLGLIYNGTMLNTTTRADRAATRAALGLDESDLAALMIANLIGPKGHLDLINALAIANRRLERPVTLLLAGRDDGMRAALEQEANRLGVGSAIRMLGQRSDVPALVRAADIGVHASHKEGFANAIIESMAGGLPMIVTRVGGNAEAVIDGVNGLVVPAKAPDEFAAALVSVAKDEQMRARFGAASRARVEQNFTLAASVDRYEALYAGLLAGLKPGEIEAVAIDQPSRRDQPVSRSGAAGAEWG